jgi:hypothetical protein
MKYLHLFFGGLWVYFIVTFYQEAWQPSRTLIYIMMTVLALECFFAYLKESIKESK